MSITVIEWNIYIKCLLVGMNKDSGYPVLAFIKPSSLEFEGGVVTVMEIGDSAITLEEPQDDAPVPKGELDEVYHLMLLEVGDKPVNVIKAVRGISGLGLKETKLLVDHAPSTILEDVCYSFANEGAISLREAGAVVSIVKNTTTTSPSTIGDLIAAQMANNVTSKPLDGVEEHLRGMGSDNDCEEAIDSAATNVSENMANGEYDVESCEILHGGLEEIEDFLDAPDEEEAEEDDEHTSQSSG